MAGNSFGKNFVITSFGESHGKAVGVVIDGCPAGITFDYELLESELNKRKPGKSPLSSQRKESDKPHVLSGVLNDKTLGTPIAILFYNEDVKSKDYERFKDTWRPSHADFTYESKYGIHDIRGGGRSSARETVCRVAAGAVAKMILSHEKITVQSFVSKIGKVELEYNHRQYNTELPDNLVRCPDPEIAEKMILEIEKARKDKDSLGGIVFTVVRNLPVGIGEPVYRKLEAIISEAIMSINATKGIAFGAGFKSTGMKGSEHNDVFVKEGDIIKPASNNAGGVLGGLSSGADLYFETAFKPVATIAKGQETVSKSGEPISLEGKGRHDPCVVPRAVPIVEAMTAISLADLLLENKLSRL